MTRAQCQCIPPTLLFLPPPSFSMTNCDPEWDCDYKNTTFSIGTMFSRHKLSFSLLVQAPLEHSDNIHLHIIHSKLAWVRILRYTRLVHAHRFGPVFISHCLLAYPYMLWKGDCTRDLRRQACRCIVGPISLTISWKVRNIFKLKPLSVRTLTGSIRPMASS